MKTLIIYRSKHGTGKKVAVCLQQKPCAGLQEADSALSQGSCERIVCVGSIYAGRLAEQLLACIRANTEELAKKSVGILLCGTGDAAPEKIITEDLGEACYRQFASSVNIGSRLNFQKLGFLGRKVTHMVNRQEHLCEDKDTVPVNRPRRNTTDSVIAGQTHEV